MSDSPLTRGWRHEAYHATLSAGEITLLPQTLAGLAAVVRVFRENPDVVRRAVAERGYTATVLLDESGDVTGRVYGVWGPPTVYLIDRAGRLVGRAMGPRPWHSRDARVLIEALLPHAEKDGSGRARRKAGRPRTPQSREGAPVVIQPAVGTHDGCEGES